MSVSVWLAPLLDVRRLATAMPRYVRYLRDWRRYARLPGAEPLRLADAHPCLHDRTASNAFDGHYFYQDIWAYTQIARRRPAEHVDVGSNVYFVGMLTAIAPVTFVDIRPLRARLAGLTCRTGSLLDLPYPDASVASLSCLHVAEHVGLGRYGDPLAPDGTRRAAAELARVLAPGGDLYFGVPVGRPRVCFNAHRVHAPQQILDYFADLRLVAFAGVDDRYHFHPTADPADFADERYACGLFHFTRDAACAPESLQ